MSCDLPQSQQGGGSLRSIRGHIACTVLTTAILVAPRLFAQSSVQPAIEPSKPTPLLTLPARQGQSVFAYLNELAEVSRNGNADATAELARQTFRNGGIPSKIADALGFTDRIVHAEAACRNGTHAPIHEADIVKAVNNLATAVGAPAWVHTNQIEVRKWRMRLLPTYPQLIASQEPPDANGHYKALSENMRPAEAAYIAITLLYQKHYNSDFQFTDEEHAQNAKLDAATVKTKQLQRTQIFGSLIRGQSGQTSLRDLQNAAGYFFDDLGIEQVANAGRAEPPTSDRAATQKGVR